MVSMVLRSLLCVQEHSDAKIGLGLLVPVTGQCNTTTYKAILDSFVLPTLWQPFGKEPHIHVVVRHPKLLWDEINVVSTIKMSCELSINTAVIKMLQRLW